MSQIKVLLCDADNTSQSKGTQGQGAGQHLYTGAQGGSDYVSYLHFALDWTGVGKIDKAVLWLYTDDHSDSSFPTATAGGLVVRPLTQPFTEGTHNFWTTLDYVHPTAPATQQRVVYNVTQALNTQVAVDITDLVGNWAPTSVKQANGNPGGNQANDGLYIGPVNWSSDQNETWWAHEYATPGLRPQIQLTYELAPAPPNTPSGLSLLPASLDGINSFEGDFTDPNPANTLQGITITVYAADGVTQLWQATRPATSSERIAAHFSFAPSNLKLQAAIAYNWTAMVQNSLSLWSVESPLQAFTLAGNPPTLGGVLPNTGTYSTLQGVLFQAASYTDPNDSPLSALQIQLAPLGVNWNDPTVVYPWDTGKMYALGGLPPASGSMSVTYTGNPVVSPGFSGTGPAVTTNLGPSQTGGLLGPSSGYAEVKYGGQPLAAGTYVWRMRVWNALDIASAWVVSGNIVLTVGFQPDPGDTVTYPEADVHAPWRLVLRGLGTKRGPGTVVGIIENPHALGVSVMFNAAGEIHFTLPIDHPQLAACQPRQTHWALEMYTTDGYRELFAGLLLDMEATEREVVFNGIDYLGLFEYVIDDRFDVTHPDLDYQHGGSKYVNLPISTVIQQELTYVIGLANSPVGFISVGTIDSALNESITIWGGNQPILRFVAGLIQSHRQGTGKRTRVKVHRTTPTYEAPAYEIRVDDNPGTTVSNLRLSYGELIQGYRVIPFGTDWSTRINAIGKDKTGLNVYYQTAVSPAIDESVWGMWSKSETLNMIADANDVQRRVLESALVASKVGRRVGLAARSGFLRPLEGFDVCDAFPVNIVHGAVNTANYGSGFWTCWGLTWEALDNGHWVTTLTLLPQEDTTQPNADLIPSNPILTLPEWQLDWVPPDPIKSTGQNYLDQSSGKVYQRNPDGTYTQIINNPRNNNLTGNSGFEITPFAQLLANNWTTNSPWSGALSTVNLNTGGTALAMTTDTY